MKVQNFVIRIQRASLLLYIKTDDVYSDIAEDLQTRFSTSNCEADRPLPKRKNKKVIGLMKDLLPGKSMKEFDGLRGKAYSYLTNNNDEYKKSNDTKKCVINKKLKFEDYKNCLEAAQTENKINNLEENKIDIDSLNELIESNNLILKIQQRLRNEKA